jgi:hypothetical protein
MKKYRWYLLLSLILISFSAFFYIVHYLIFRDAHHIFIYLIGDIAFVFIEVLLVTVIIHRLLSERDKRNRLEKIKMLIGTFFSEFGTALLAFFSRSDPAIKEVRDKLIVKNEWTGQHFLQLRKYLENYQSNIRIQKGDLETLRRMLAEQRDLFMMLLLNPNLLEHESFTDLLHAVSHLAQELMHRKDLTGLPDTDYRHLSGDIFRAYTCLIHEWVNYMQYLKDNYPFLFSLAMRTNPFDPGASPVVK